LSKSHCFCSPPDICANGTFEVGGKPVRLDAIDIAPQQVRAETVDARVDQVHLQLLQRGGGLAPLPMAALQVLHAGSFGLVHLGTMGFLARAVPVQLSASAQSLFSMMAYGICTGLATLAAGPLYQAVQGHAYLLSVGLSLVAAGLMLILRRRWHGEVLFEIR
jgi:hypothetical protein